LAVVVLAAAAAAFGQAAPPSAGQAAGGQENYVIGRGDVLNVTVYDQPELSGKYPVESDGSFRFPLVGRVKAAGLTLRQAEADLRRLLSPDYLKNPQLTINLDQFRGQRVFVFGAVSSPGTYPLADGTTIIEVLVKAGYGAASVATVLRPRNSQSGPLQPGAAGVGETIRVNLRELEKDVENGILARNIALRDGDTVFVPRFDPNRIYVTGEVKSPGAYSVPEGTTVLQAITLAGGVTEKASLRRTQIIRLVKGEQKKVNAKMSDIVQPGDTVVVNEKLF
jgi:polysaccharide export outer membrane protein